MAIVGRGIENAGSRSSLPEAPRGSTNNGYNKAENPHEATPEQLGQLVDLAAVVMDQLELRLEAMNTLRDEREIPPR